MNDFTELEALLKKEVPYNLNTMIVTPGIWFARVGMVLSMAVWIPVFIDIPNWFTGGMLAAASVTNLVIWFTDAISPYKVGWRPNSKTPFIVKRAASAHPGTQTNFADIFNAQEETGLTPTIIVKAILAAHHKANLHSTKATAILRHEVARSRRLINGPVPDSERGKLTVFGTERIGS